MMNMLFGQWGVSSLSRQSEFTQVVTAVVSGGNV